LPTASFLSPQGELGLRRSVLGDVGGFDEGLTRAEDIDFSWRAWYAGYRVHFEPRAVVRITMRSDLTSLARTRFRGGMNEVRLYKRHRHSGMQPEPRGWVTSTWSWLARTAPRLVGDSAVRYEWSPPGETRRSARGLHPERVLFL